MHIDHIQIIQAILVFSPNNNYGILALFYANFSNHSCHANDIAAYTAQKQTLSKDIEHEGYHPT